MKQKIKQLFDGLDQEAVEMTVAFFKTVVIRAAIIIPSILLFVYAAAHFPVLFLLPFFAGIVAMVYRVKLDQLESDRRWGSIEKKYSDLSHRRPQK